MNIKKIIFNLGLVGLGVLASGNVQAKHLRLTDSIGVEYKDGKEIVIHRLVAKESYYSLSRLYKVSPKEIMAYNAEKSLKIGDLVKIPTDRPYQTPSEHLNNQVLTPPKQTNPIQNPDPEFIEYIVGKGETLYTIAKRFNVSVDEISSYNNLINQKLRADQLLKIPQASKKPPVHQTDPEVLESLIITEENEESFSLSPDKYGLTQVSNRGIGVWMESLNTEDGKMLALHKTAPVGTIIKITNPMTQRTTYAKVVGKYNDNNDTRDAIVVISKATASLLGIIDKRFLVTISYGMPNKE